MVLKKNTKINNLHILKEAPFENIYLVRLINIGSYGGKTNPILSKLIKIRPDFEVVKSQNSCTCQWSDIFSLKDESVKEDIKIIFKNLGDFFNVIF